jgi:hypothetical protein
MPRANDEDPGQRANDSTGKPGQRENDSVRATLAGTAGAPPRAGRLRRSLGRLGTPGAVTIAFTLFALALRGYQLGRAGHLLGVGEYDDGADFGSAVLLIHGLVPYRNFVIVQPPGITLLMVPFAALSPLVGTDWAIAAAKIATALAGGAAVLLGGRLVRHQGLLATVIACGILAIFPASVQAAHTVLLEPWVVLLCLAGMAVAFDSGRVVSTPRLAWGGVLFGAATAVKLWAILPIAVITVLCLPARARRPGRKPPRAAEAQQAPQPGEAAQAREPGGAGQAPRWRRGQQVSHQRRAQQAWFRGSRPGSWRRAGSFAAGAAAGFVLPALPFALAAPRQFWDSVFVAQLMRSGTRTSMTDRLAKMAGIDSWHPGPVVAVAVACVIAALLIGCLLVARARGSRPAQLEVFALATTGLVVAAFLLVRDFYYHYPAFLAPFLALSLGLMLPRLIAARWPAGAGGAATPSRRAERWAAAVAAVALITLPVADSAAESTPVPTYAAAVAALNRTVPRGACVVTDQVSVLFAADRFAAGRRDCPASRVIDGTGISFALGHGRTPLTAGSVPAVARVWWRAFRTARFVLLTPYNTRRIAWTPGLQGYLRRHFQPLTHGGWWPLRLYVRIR